MKKTALTFLLASLLTACGGSDSSSGGGEAKATHCVDYSKGDVTNRCEFDVYARGISIVGTQDDDAVFVPANKTVDYPHYHLFSWNLYACRAPYKPWLTGGLVEPRKFSCYDPKRYPDQG